MQLARATHLSFSSLLKRVQISNLCDPSTTPLVRHGSQVSIPPLTNNQSRYRTETGQVLQPAEAIDSLYVALHSTCTWVQPSVSTEYLVSLPLLACCGVRYPYPRRLAYFPLTCAAGNAASSAPCSQKYRVGPDTGVTGCCKLGDHHYIVITTMPICNGKWHAFIVPFKEHVLTLVHCTCTSAMLLIDKSSKRMIAG